MRAAEDGDGHQQSTDQQQIFPAHCILPRLRRSHYLAADGGRQAPGMAYNSAVHPVDNSFTTRVT